MADDVGRFVRRPVPVGPGGPAGVTATPRRGPGVLYRWRTSPALSYRSQLRPAPTQGRWVSPAILPPSEGEGRPPPSAVRRCWWVGGGGACTAAVLSRTPRGGTV